ncbi:MAG: EamA family transporter RarD [Planctomycetota bacterium]|nr:EamA family transporter RarD [Planctomycetota bacterium]
MKDETKLSGGYVAAVAAYALWGIIPLYWQLLNRFDPVELICHRVFWAFITLTIVLVYLKFSDPHSISRHQQKDIFLGLIYIPVEQRSTVICWSIVASILVGVNWLVFVWCVQAKMIVESSLGYFINPLMSVALGVIVLGERLRWINWVSIALAASGVAYLTWQYGSVPYLALTLALSFGLYGLVKKRASLAAIPGLWLETMMLFVPAVVYLAYRFVNGISALGQDGFGWDLLIASTGPVTTIPLLLFAFGAQRIPLSTMGLLQFIAPTLQFWMGWYVMREPVPAARWFGFVMVWAGLAIYVASSIWIRSRRIGTVAVE